MRIFVAGVIRIPSTASSPASFSLAFAAGGQNGLSFTLLQETKANWLGKLAFEPLYWNVLLDGKHLGMPPTLVMAGKHVG